MKTEFTPGPWEISENMVEDFGDETYIIGPSDTSEGARFVEEQICQVWSQEHDTLANARLIASAPCLLEALEACHEAMQYMSEYDIPTSLPGKVEAAIKRARGE